jgi:natural product precursor
MKDFKKLSRNEMKNLKGGQPMPPQCTVGSICTGSVFRDGGYHFVSGTCNGDCICTASNQFLY